MTFHFGKAIEGGTPLTEHEMNDLARTRLVELRKALGRDQAPEKSDDVLAIRLGEELRFVQRMIGLVEDKLPDAMGDQAKKQLARSEAALEDIAEVIEAKDRCDAIMSIDDDIARRLTRSSLDGAHAPCKVRRSAS